MEKELIKLIQFARVSLMILTCVVFFNGLPSCSLKANAAVSDTSITLSPLITLVPKSSPLPVVGTLSVQLMPLNPNRKGFVVWNNSQDLLYVTLAATATLANSSYIIGGMANVAWLCFTNYGGAISAIRVKGSGPVTFYEF